MHSLLRGYARQPSPRPLLCPIVVVALGSRRMLSHPQHGGSVVHDSSAVWTRQTPIAGFPASDKPWQDTFAVKDMRAAFQLFFRPTDLLETNAARSQVGRVPSAFGTLLFHANATFGFVLCKSTTSKRHGFYPSTTKKKRFFFPRVPFFQPTCSTFPFRGLTFTIFSEKFLRKVCMIDTSG